MDLQSPFETLSEMPADMPLHALSVAQASALIGQKKITPVQLVQACIERIARFDDQTHAFVTPTLDAALQAAHQSAREIAQGHYRGPLHGIPIAHKDVFLTPVQSDWASGFDLPDGRVSRRTAHGFANGCCTGR